MKSQNSVMGVLITEGRARSHWPKFLKKEEYPPPKKYFWSPIYDEAETSPCAVWSFENTGKDIAGFSPENEQDTKNTICGDHFWIVQVGGTLRMVFYGVRGVPAMTWGIAPPRSQRPVAGQISGGLGREPRVDLYVKIREIQKCTVLAGKAGI